MWAEIYSSHCLSICSCVVSLSQASLFTNHVRLSIPPPFFSELKITAGTSSFMSCIFSPHFTLCSLCVLHTVKHRLADKKKLSWMHRQETSIVSGYRSSTSSSTSSSSRGSRGTKTETKRGERVWLSCNAQRSSKYKQWQGAVLLRRGGPGWMSLCVCVRGSFNTSCWFRAKIFDYIFACDRIIHISIYYLIALHIVVWVYLQDQEIWSICKQKYCSSN